MSLFNLCRVNYFYPQQDNPAIDDLTISIEEGEFVLVLGPSGGGKSTFARILGGFIPEYYGGNLAGEILFHGNPITFRQDFRRHVGMVFQNPERQILAHKVEGELTFGMEKTFFTGAVSSGIKCFGRLP